MTRFPDTSPFGRLLDCAAWPEPTRPLAALAEGWCAHEPTLQHRWIG